MTDRYEDVLLGLALGLIMGFLVTLAIFKPIGVSQGRSSSNIEEWSVERDKNGFPVNVKVRREVHG